MIQNKLRSKIILGTVQLGTFYGINNFIGKPSVRKSYEILEEAYSYGLRELDTAPLYGQAEILIGKFHKNNPSFKINTKFIVSKSKSVEQQVDESLKRLCINGINTVFFHRFSDFSENGSKIFFELIELKRSKRIKYIGISVYTNEEFASAINSPEIDVIQFPYNVLDNFSIRGNLIEKAIKNKKILQGRSVFLQGLFFMDTKMLPKKLKPLTENLNEIHALATSKNITVNELSLNYVIHTKQISKVLIGIDSLGQLKNNLDGIKSSFPNDLIRKISNFKVENPKLLNPSNWK